MWPERFDCVVTVSAPDETTVRILQTNGTWSRLPGLALMAVLAGVVVAPQMAIAAFALAAPGARHAIAESPGVAVQLALALIVWIGLICWPLRVALSRVARRRSVEIAGGSVRVEDSNPFGREVWSAPLLQFSGVAHHIRTSISAVRHEVILAHPDRARSLLLSAGEHITEADVEAWSRTLAMPVAPASNLYRRSRSGPSAKRAPGTVEPVTLAAAAA